MLNYLNILLDGLILLLAMPLSFVIRFFVLRSGIISVPFSHYMILTAALVPVYLVTFVSFGLYESFRKKRLYQELGRLLGLLPGLCFATDIPAPVQGNTLLPWHPVHLLFSFSFWAGAKALYPPKSIAPL